MSNSDEKKIGWTVTENIGVGIYNPRSVRIEVCPVCSKTVYSVLDHAESLTDNDHQALIVHAT